MKNTVTISDYAAGRYNTAKLEKLKTELENLFTAHKERTGQSIHGEGLIIEINMWAKYQSLYIKVSNWGSYMAVGEFEDLVAQALGNRGFEVTELSGDDDYLKTEFE